MNDTPANGADQQQDAPLSINGQYVKDLSFESPNSPGILAELQNKQPEVKVNVDVKAGKIEGQPVDNMFEVILSVSADLKIEGTVGFIVELDYAGVFTLNVPEEHLSAMLLIECPRMLFPFARNILADMTRDGGFVPLFLQPIDFAALYQANLENQTEQLDKDVADLVEKKAPTEGKTKGKAKK